MASQINPNNIDGAYPVAGQDNNSQGFRDNFTNTKVNFQYAEDEINDLQNNVILKSALTGSSLDNNMNDNTIRAVNINDASTTRIVKSATSGAVNINFAEGGFQTVGSTTGSVTLSFTNFPVSGFYGLVTVAITIGSIAHTVTLPAAVTGSTTGIQGLNSSVITFPAVGTYVFSFSTSDGGATVYIDDLSRPRATFSNPLFLASSENLTSGDAASLSVTASYFSTSGASTATLAAGVNGQIKTFAMAADSGDMVITVSNAGWKTLGTGTITFDDIGDGCTLQYINSKWYCIGNNGAVFA
jgi:hypothetical protein